MIGALRERHRILRRIREFFWARGFLEVETPVMLPSPSQEPYLEPLRTTVHDHRGKAYDGFLRMSPEFSLKKLLARMRGKTSGVDRGTPDVEERMRGIFEIGPVFRDGEPWGGSHNPEFTLLEWYELGADYRTLMTTCEELLSFLCHSEEAKPTRNLARNVGAALRGRPQRGRGRSPAPTLLAYQGQTIDVSSPWERLTMRQAWKRYARLDLDAILARSTMARACRAKGYTVTKDDTFDDLFFKIHLTEVEPKLGRTKPTFLTDWPTQMAGLARRKPKDPRYAERVELYIGGLEIANGFSELTDADEQLRRFKADQRLRQKLGKPVHPIDPDFIAALRRLPPCAGMALGVDRLVMLFTDTASIDEVRWLPASELLQEHNRATESADSPEGS